MARRKGGGAPPALAAIGDRGVSLEDRAVDRPVVLVILYEEDSAPSHCFSASVEGSLRTSAYSGFDAVRVPATRVACELPARTSEGR